MSSRHFFAYLTRISNLPDTPFTVEQLPKAQWATGDYVVGEVNPHHRELSSIELGNGRMIEVTDSDQIVGAFGELAQDILSEESRHRAAKVYRIGPIPERRRRSGTERRSSARAPVLAPGRRSGRTSALPYPPSR